MNLTILLTKHYRPLSFAALYDVFQSVNMFYRQERKHDFFKITIACAEAGRTIDGITTVPLAAVAQTDLILVPAFLSGNLEEYLQSNYEVVPWLLQHYQNKAEIASFCTGAYMLAVAGLLNGKKATTHVLATNGLKLLFPDVVVEKDSIITDDGGIYTSGGATSSFHLMLYLLEKYCGRDIAIKTSKFFAIDMDREQQSYFASFLPVKHHYDKEVSRTQDRMEASFSTITTIDELIKDLPVSRRNFIRRFKIATGVTPIEYLQNIRVEAAKKLLEQTNLSVTAVVMEVGYNDSKAFRQLFKRIVGLLPSEYREKYIRQSSRSLKPLRVTS